MKKIVKLSTVSFLTFFYIVSCKTTTYVPAPESSNSSEIKIDSISEGRNLYDAKCNSCHRIYNPEKFTKNEWSRILPRMQRKAKLSVDESRIMKVYVDSKCKQ